MDGVDDYVPLVRFRFDERVVVVLERLPFGS